MNVCKEGPKGEEVTILINPSGKARPMQFVLFFFFFACSFIHQLISAYRVPENTLCSERDSSRNKTVSHPEGTHSPVRELEYLQ